MPGRAKKAPAKKKAANDGAAENAVNAEDDIYDPEYKRALRWECRKLDELIVRKKGWPAFITMSVLGLTTSGS